MIEKKIIFQYTEDKNGKMDASYITLAESLEDSSTHEAAHQILVDDKGVQGNENFRGELIVDIDKEGRVIGIEILGDVIPQPLKE